METTYESRGAAYRLAVLAGHDAAALSPLLCDVFGSTRFTPDWIQKKYSLERNGVRGFLCAAFAEDGQPAAALGVLPWPIRHGTSVELAGQIGESSTATAHRGRGLFVRLVQLAHEACATAGMTFVVRFPNELSFPITISKLGYTHLGDLVEYQRPVRTLWLERAARRAALGGAYDRWVQLLTNRTADADPAPLSSVLDEGYAGVDRDTAFLTYKAAFGGSRVLSIDGARAWVVVRHGMLVGDLAAGSERELAVGVEVLESLARRVGAHRLLFQASDDIRLSRYLATRQPEVGRRPVAYFDLRSRIPRDALRFTLGDIDTF